MDEAGDRLVTEREVLLDLLQIVKCSRFHCEKASIHSWNKLRRSWDRIVKLQIKLRQKRNSVTAGAEASDRLRDVLLDRDSIIAAHLRFEASKHAYERDQIRNNFTLRNRKASLINGGYEVKWSS